MQPSLHKSTLSSLVVVFLMSTDDHELASVAGEVCQASVVSIESLQLEQVVPLVEDTQVLNSASVAAICPHVPGGWS